MHPLFLVAALALSPATARPSGFDRETIIAQAGGGNLREWQRGEVTGVLYVRDRTEHWYRVTLTGPCRMDRPLDTLTYTTDPTGNFDRFSRIRLLRYPDTACGVASIRTSAAPPGRRGAKKPARN